jgi:heat shock protein HslJ
MEGDNAALERGYAYAGGTAGEPILVNLEGRIAQRPSMEPALPPQRSLVPIRFNHAWPGETCTKRTAMTSAPDSRPSPLALERTRWGLLDSRLAAPAPGAGRDRVRIEFAADRLSANSGCNTGAAGYRIEADGTLVLTTAMATTMMACLGEAAAYERAFFAFLGSRPRVSREAGGEVLVLRGPAAAESKDSHFLRLRSVPMASASARQKFIYVASERAPCVGVAPMQCLQVRESRDQPWRMFYGEIVGFEFQPGTEYRLRILEDDVPNPPADGSSKRWFLDLVVERRVVRAEK